MAILPYLNFIADPKRPSTSTTIVNSHTDHPTPITPSATTLDYLALGQGAHYTGPPINKPPSAYTHSPFGTPSTSEPPAWLWREPTDDEIARITPNELEMSRPPSPTMDGAADVVQTFWNPTMNKWRVLSACLIYFGNGMNDSAPGALLPYMEKYYNVGYAIVSLIFIANAAGFILAAFFIHALDRKLGRAKTLMLCDAALMIGHTMMAVAPPFPVFVLGFFVTGLAMATNLALNNVFIANLAGATVLLGAAQGTYGIGGIIGPIIATSLVTHGVLFSRFYYIMIAIRFLSLITVGVSFWHFERDTAPPNATLLTPLERTASRSQHQSQSTSQAKTAGKPNQVQELLSAINNRTTLMGAFFVFAYQGAEVSISGWVISFLINYRHSPASTVGYVTAGFWGGITLGRFVITPLCSRFGEKLSVYVLTLGALTFQLLVWLVPNVIGDSVSIAIVGLLLGPVYPAATTVFARLLPRGDQNTALAFVASAGSSGGAVAPFLTGLGAQAVGTWVLHPVCIGLFVAMEGCWFFLPKVMKRRE